MTLRNEGHRRVEAARRVTVSCLQGALPIAECPPVLELAPSEGNGSLGGKFTVRLAMGHEYRLRLRLPEDAERSLTVNVPERILGVDRVVWDCYSDREQIRPMVFRLGLRNH